MRLSQEGRNGPDSPGTRGHQWDALVGRIMVSAGPELARLRARHSLRGQVEAWTGPLLPLAAVLILAFGSLFAWVGADPTEVSQEAPLMAEVLVPEALVFWLEAGARLTLEEMVAALEEGER